MRGAGSSLDVLDTFMKQKEERYKHFTVDDFFFFIGAEKKFSKVNKLMYVSKLF